MYKTIGTIERIDPGLDIIIDSGTKAEIIAEGFDWSEGPVWIESQHALLFSDVPQNIVYKWTEEKGKEVYLTPSGYTDSVKRGGEMGSNGLLLDPSGNLVLCQHGNRQVARMDAVLSDRDQSSFQSQTITRGKNSTVPMTLSTTAMENYFLLTRPTAWRNSWTIPKRKFLSREFIR